MVVPTLDPVDAGRVLHHRLVDLEPQVAEDDDDVDHRPQQVHVALRGLNRVERLDSERVRLLEYRTEAGEVPHPDDADLQAGHVEHREGLEDDVQAPVGRGPGRRERVVGGEDREVRPLLELTLGVDGAVVELVVADGHGIGAHHAFGARLGLAVEEVEDGGALEDVAGVEVEHAVCARALAVHDVRHAGDAADVLHLTERSEAELGVDLQDLQGVRENARVDVRGVQEREADLAGLAGRARGLGAAATGGAARLGGGEQRGACGQCDGRDSGTKDRGQAASSCRVTKPHETFLWRCTRCLARAMESGPSYLMPTREGKTIRPRSLYPMGRGQIFGDRRVTDRESCGPASGPPSPPRRRTSPPRCYPQAGRRGPERTFPRRAPRRPPRCRARAPPPPCCSQSTLVTRRTASFISGIAAASIDSSRDPEPDQEHGGERVAGHRAA